MKMRVYPVVALAIVAMLAMAMSAMAAVPSPYATMYDNAVPAAANYEAKAGYDTVLNGANASANFTVEVSPVVVDIARVINVTYYICDELGVNITAHCHISAVNSSTVTGWVNFTALQMGSLTPSDNVTLYITVERNGAIKDTFQTVIEVAASDMSYLVDSLIPFVVAIMVIGVVVKIVDKSAP
jgi:hypothetical protein